MRRGNEFDISLDSPGFPVYPPPVPFTSAAAPVPSRPAGRRRTFAGEAIMTHKNHVFRTVALSLAALLALASCGKERKKTVAFAQLDAATVAVPTGTAADAITLQKFPKAKMIYFNTVLDCCMAVKAGNADAAAYDEPVLKNIVAKYPELAVLPEMISVDRYGFAVNLGRPDLKTAVDETVRELKLDGTYSQMMDRWLPKAGTPGPMPTFETAGEAKVLRFGTAAVVEPFTFVAGGGQVSGFDVELAHRVARRLGMKLEIVDMDFGTMIPSLIAGKVDLIAACITITAERAKSVLFSEPYYDGGIAAVVLK